MFFYFQIYLIGCVLTFCLTLVKVGLAKSVSWLTGDNVLFANVRKIQPPNTASLPARISKFALIVMVESALSWINVAMVSWQIVIILLAPIRSLFAMRSEAVKSVLFPLRHNPYLASETVWANLTAFNILNGQRVSMEEIVTSLEEVKENRPNFDKERALKELRATGVLKSMDSDTRSSA